MGRNTDCQNDPSQGGIPNHGHDCAYESAHDPDHGRFLLCSYSPGFSEACSGGFLSDLLSDFFSNIFSNFFFFCDLFSGVCVFFAELRFSELASLAALATLMASTCSGEREAIFAYVGGLLAPLVTVLATSAYNESSRFSSIFTLNRR